MPEILNIPSGTKIQIAFDMPIGKKPDFNMICTFGRALDTSAFLISVPMLSGKALILDENQKFLFHYAIGSENIIFAAYPDAMVKEGIRRYWKMRRVTELRQFFQRKDERFKVSIKVQYSQPTWKPDANGVIRPEEAMTVDISAGGFAAMLNERFEVGEVLDVTLPRIGATPAGAPIDHIMSVICWLRDAPKGSLYRYLAGMQFRIDAQREPIANYVDTLRDIYHL